MMNLRGPPGGPPLPANPGGPAPGKPAPPNPGNPPGGAGPPMPAAGPPNPTGSPRPAGLLIPGPAAIVGGAPAPPGALVPSLAEGSAGGGPSTEQETICVPRTIVRPKVRFSSDSTRADVAAPGAEAVPLVGLRFTRRNSSVSAKTRFMCCSSISESKRMELKLNKTCLIECQHLTGHLSPVIESYSHPKVDLSQRKPKSANPFGWEKSMCSSKESLPDSAIIIVNTASLIEGQDCAEIYHLALLVRHDGRESVASATLFVQRLL